MHSNNTWKSQGTVLCILAISTHTLASTYICFIEDTFQTKNTNFVFSFFQKFPLGLGLGLGLGLVSKLNTALQEET